MSLDIRYVTNGQQKFYRVIDSSTETFDIYNTLGEVPESIRHYAAGVELKFCQPDLARMFGVIDILYPNYPKCGLEGYEGKNCIAESCRHTDRVMLDGSVDCPYFDKSWRNKALWE